MSQEVKALTATAKATKALLASSASLAKICNDLNVNVLANEQVLESIAEGQVKLDSLSAETAIAVRNQAVELELQVKENEAGVLDKLLSDRDLAKITVDEVAELRKTNLDLQADNMDAISKAVAIAVSSTKSKAETELANAVSEHKVESATLEANAVALGNEIAFLKRSISTLEENAKSERQARVDIAASEANKAGVVVNSGK